MSKLDALNGMVCLDKETFKDLTRFAMHLGVLDLDKPRKLSRNSWLPPPVISTISNWMYNGK